MIMPFNNRTRCISCLTLTLFALLPFAPPLYADAAPRWTDAQLAGFSDVIARGRVLQIAVAQDERVGSPYTYVTIDVAEILKGSVPERRIVVKQLGGRLGATALQIAGQPMFAVGEDVLLFLEARPRDRTLTVTAQWQGKFTIAADGQAVRDDPAGAARGIFSDQTRTLAQWLPDLRREVGLAPASRAAGAIDVAPQVAARATLASNGALGAAAVWRDASLAGQAVRVDSSPGQARLLDNGERQVRQAADFWSGTGITPLATGGLQPSGCFTTRAPDGRISIGVDACEELSPAGGIIALSGGWVQFDADASGLDVPRFLGAGVITNRGETATRLLARPGCFEELLKHELGHALGLIDSPDGAGVMASTLRCEAGLGRVSGGAVNDGSRPTFVPLQAAGTTAAGRPDALDAVTCAVGCQISAAAVISAPNAPTALAASLSGTSLTLTWTAPATDESHAAATGYTVEQGTSSGATDLLAASIGSTATTYTNTVAAGTTVYARVRGTNTFGASDPSTELAVVVPASPAPTPSAPGAPTSLAFTLSGSTLTLTWTAPASGSPTSYVLEAGSSSGGTDVANFSTGNATTTFSAAVGGNAVFYIRVRATNATGTGVASNEIIVAIGNAALPPDVPTALTATVSGSTVTLGWTAPSSGGAPSNYIIEAGSASGTANLANFSTGSTATTFSAAGVAAGTYFVRVRAANGSGTSAASNEVLILVGSSCVAPIAPANLTASITGSTVVLSWSPGTGATSYQLQAGSNTGEVNLVDSDLLSSSTTLTALNVSPGTYFVRLRSKNACGLSAPSNEVLVILQ